MSGPRDAIRDAAAMGALQVCKALGAQIDYQNNGESAVSGIYAMPLSESTNPELFMRLDVDTQAKIFSVPKQAGFPPPAGVQAKAMVTYPTSTGEVYSVERVTADSLGATYRLECKLTTPRRVGPNA